MPFPIHRKRRLRVSEPIRRLVRETHLEPSQFVLPLFVCPGEGVRRPISSMPGNFQLSVDELVKECETAHAAGLGGVILFGIPDKKDEEASEAYAENGITQRAVRAVKRALPKLLLAIQEAPTFPVPYRWLASCFAHMGRLDEARDVVRRLRALTPVVVPSATQFRNPEHRELLLSGLRLAAGEAT